VGFWFGFSVGFWFSLRVFCGILILTWDLLWNFDFDAVFYLDYDFDWDLLIKHKIKNIINLHINK
jgi:hypothetical protein